MGSLWGRSLSILLLLSTITLLSSVLLLLTVTLLTSVLLLESVLLLGRVVLLRVLIVTLGRTLLGVAALLGRTRGLGHCWMVVGVVGHELSCLGVC